MWSTATIVHLSAVAAAKAKYEEREPYHPASVEEVQNWETFPYPNLGDYTPAGWWLIDTALLDRTGRGSSYEPAQTWDQNRAWVVDILKKDPDAGFGTVEIGQFQAVVGYFTSNSEVAEGAGIDVQTEDGDIEIVECHNCGEPNPKDDDYCNYCDVNLDEDACPDCDENPCECEEFEFICVECHHLVTVTAASEPSDTDEFECGWCEKKVLFGEWAFDDDETAFYEGLWAYWKGKAPVDNPYMLESREEYHEWNRGFTWLMYIGE